MDTIVASPDDLVRRGQNQATWVEIGREQLIVGGQELWLLALERSGDEAALVVVRTEAANFRVIGVFGVSQGGLGASLAVTEHWSDTARRTAFVVVQINRRFRGFTTEAGKWMYPGGYMTWAVLGLRADTAWVARPEDPNGSRVRIVDTPAGPVLATACVARPPLGARNVVFQYERRTGTFVGECSAGRPDTPRLLPDEMLRLR